MKIKSILMTIFLGIFVFTSCQDNKKKDEMNNEMNDPNMEMSEGADDEKMMDEGMNDASNEKSVADVVEGSEKHTTLLAAMKDAGIVVKLDGETAYTVFAPTNAAFEALPKGTIDDWMKPENSEDLEGVLSYHIVPGNVDSAKLTELIKSSENQEYVLVTANDGKLTATINDAGNVILTDASGGQATVVAADMEASNGVVHSINGVLMRK